MTTTCPVCWTSSSSTQKLKTHILLKHRDVRLCLYCVESKGWSDMFASNSHYNEHVEKSHLSVAKLAPNSRTNCNLCRNNNCHTEFQSVMQLERHLVAVHGYECCKSCNLLGPPIAMRHHIASCHSDHLCVLCSTQGPRFSSNSELKQHLRNSHSILHGIKCSECGEKFANCQNLAMHLLERHLTSADRMRPMRKRNRKLAAFYKDTKKKKDNKDNSNICLNMDNNEDDYNINASSSQEISLDSDNVVGNQSDLTASNNEDVGFNSAGNDGSSEKLGKFDNRSNERQNNDEDNNIVDISDAVEIVSKPSCTTETKEKSAGKTSRKSGKQSVKSSNSNLPIMNCHHVCGIRNENGMDCFAISALHLLAQTPLSSFLCKNASSENEEVFEKFRNFFDQYKSSKTMSSKLIEPNLLDLDENNSDCGDFLRAAIDALNDDTDTFNSTFYSTLEWKYECLKCTRYIVSRTKDCLLRVSASSPASLDDLVEKAIFQRTCPVCKQKQRVVPSQHSKLADFLMIEIDRSEERNDSTENEEMDEEHEEESMSKDLSLFSLQLEPAQNHLWMEGVYRIFATINYHLEIEGGGHYLTRLFPKRFQHRSCLKIHEDLRALEKLLPDFDVATFIVALVRTEVKTKS